MADWTYHAGSMQFDGFTTIYITIFVVLGSSDHIIDIVKALHSVVFQPWQYVNHLKICAIFQSVQEFVNGCSEFHKKMLFLKIKSCSFEKKKSNRGSFTFVCSF